MGGARVGVGEPGPEPDALRLEPATVAADDEVPARHPAPQAGLYADAQQAQPGQPPEQVLPSEPFWKPELPPPTTSTDPSGKASGLRYSELCSWVTEASSRWAAGGTNGTWNGPVATTTRRARKTSRSVRTSKPSWVRARSVTQAFSLTGRSNVAA